MAELDRRDFLKLVGVSAGGAAATGCSDPVEKLIPYVVQPEVITPGIAVFYASSCLECSTGCGLHVRTREGRPIKLEGNPEHPVNRGALCARGQAGIGRTYHPDRYRQPLERQADGSFAEIGWEAATARLAAKIQEAPKGTFVLGGATGPTLSDLIDRWIAAVGAGGRLVYETFADEALAAATRAVFGTEARARFDLSGADYVLDFASDFLDSGRSPVEHQRQLDAARDVATEAGRAARFVSVSPRLSTTTASSDEWLPARPGTEGILALGIARVALEERRTAGLPVGGDAGLLEGVLRRFDSDAVAKQTDVPAATIRRIGHELAAAKAPVALPPGVGVTSRRATSAVGAVLILNAVIGAVGRGVSLDPDFRPPASFQDVADLIASMQAGDVRVLLIHDANPVYSLPKSLGFEAALEKVGLVVSFASIPDETSTRAHLVLPDHTALESWGDTAPRPGVRGIVQPTLRPLYDTQALGDTLLATARVLGGDAAAALPAASFRHMVEQAWSDTDFRAALGRGGSFADAPAVGGAVAASAAKLEFEVPVLDGDGEFALLVHPSPLLHDGRGANLPWLQETPDPVTKIAWTSWLEMNRDAARRLGVTEGDVVAVETSAGRVEVPIYPRGGLREDVVALAVGQGHTVGLFASGANDGRPGEARGVNALDLLPAATDETGGRAWFTVRARLTPTGAHRRLPNVQRSDNKRGRQLGEALTLAELARGDWNADANAPAVVLHGEPGHGGGNPERPALGAPEGHAAPEAHGAAEGNAAAGGHGGVHEIRRPFDAGQDAVEASPYRWAMTIDLDRCNGCSACVVACSIENNVPTVGEGPILRNRSMSWLRIERFVGEGEPELLTGRQRPEDHEQLGNVDVRHSPMLCQQCGAAPCEPVCPVLATYHNAEGLNGMIYNRCIGTRYCSNNCPYKVRRFNWFDYGIHNWPDPMPLMLNPDVTVRGQGVMEKCTFCAQRIEGARQAARDQNRPIADGEAVPACAQTCASGAIVFGNARDPKSRASEAATSGRARAYRALHVLNTRPAITYLAKVIRSEDGEKHG